MSSSTFLLHIPLISTHSTIATSIYHSFNYRVFIFISIFFSLTALALYLYLFLYLIYISSKIVILRPPFAAFVLTFNYRVFALHARYHCVVRSHIEIHISMLMLAFDSNKAYYKANWNVLYTHIHPTHTHSACADTDTGYIRVNIL